MKLREEQIERYLHHIVLKDIGGEGQKELLSSKILIVGAGGLGSPVAFYLAAAGIGTIGIIDDDCVELGNLQRQILHSMRDIGRRKVMSARKRIEELNSDVKVITHAKRLEVKNAESVIDGYDFVIDCSDNFPTKYLINDACVLFKKSFSHGGVVAFNGLTFTHVPQSACLRCIFPAPPPANLAMNCRGTGILGSVAGMVGTIQATEAIKYILRKDGLLANRIMTIDALSMVFRNIALKPNRLCLICGDKPSITKLIKSQMPSDDVAGGHNECCTE